MEYQVQDYELLINEAFVTCDEYKLSKDGKPILNTIEPIYKICIVLNLDEVIDIYEIYYYYSKYSKQYFDYLINFCSFIELFLICTEQLLNLVVSIVPHPCVVPGYEGLNYEGISPGFFVILKNG